MSDLCTDSVETIQRYFEAQDMDFAYFAAAADKVAGSIAADKPAGTAASAALPAPAADSIAAADIPAEDTAGNIAAAHHNRVADTSVPGNSAAGIADTAPASCRFADKSAGAYRIAPGTVQAAAAHSPDDRRAPAALSA